MSKRGYTTKLSTIANVIQGQSPESNFYSEYDGFPFLQGNRTFGSLYPFFDTYTKKITKIAKKGDVLMSVRAPVGALNFAPCDLCIGRGLASIRAKDGNNQFIYYALKYNVNNLIKQGSATTFDSVNKDIINDFELIIPIDKDERVKIAKVLSDLDAKIELNNRINRGLEAMAKTLYDYWFVQFDFPYSPPTEGCPQDGVGIGKPYKSSGGKMVYNAELKREIPEGWEVKNIFKCCKVQYGFPFSTDYFNTVGKGIPVIRIRDVLENSISNFSSEQNIDAKYLIKKGDILVGMDGNFHINYWAKDGCYLNQRAVKLSEIILPNIYLKYQIEPFIKLREKSVSRTTVGHLSDKDLKALSIIIPSKEVLSSIISIYNGVLQRMIQTKNENQQLSELRDWLLPMLMNGQVVSTSSTTRAEMPELVEGMAAEPSVKYKKG